MHRKLGSTVLAAVLAIGLTVTAEGGSAAYAAPRAAQADPQAPGEGAPEEGSPTDEAAGRAARETGRPVEVLAKRGEDRETYANPDGTFTTVEHLRPVRVRQGDSWVAPDTTLVRRPDGSIGPRASTVGLSLSGGGDAPLARVARAGREMSLKWPGGLPEPELQGDSAVYHDVMKDVDLVVRADVDGFSHTLVVKTREAAANNALARLTLGLGGAGVGVRAKEGGAVEAVDAAGGGALFEAPAAVMWDSGTPAPALKAATSAPLERGPSDTSKVAGLNAAVEGGNLTLTPDRALLDAPDTRYPVYIDPVWKTVKASAWAYVSRTYPSTSYYKFGGKADSGLGLCSGDSKCAPSDVKRIFYRMPTSAYAGKYIISADFVAKETWSYSCDGRTVQLWRTKGFIESSTWNSTSDNWLEHLDTRDVAKGWSSSCPAGDVEFDATKAVKDASAGKWSTTTFGLRAGYETDAYGWKRFADDAYLRVNYNTPPPQPKMSDLSMNPGGTCVYSPAPAVRVPPTISAVLYDADSADAKKVYAEFGATWDGAQKWSSGKIGPKTTGSTFQVTLPASIPEKKTINWYVRTWDGYQYSPWSYAGDATACYFSYDKSVPAAPTLSSTAYPQSDPENEADPWYDGVGRYGRFTAASSSTDVVKYWFGVNSNPTSANERKPSSAGGAVTIDIAPDHAGPNYLTVKAFDAAGNSSEIGRYVFRVKAGSPAKAQWALDEPIDSTQVADVSGAYPATVYGGVTLGVDGMSKTAIQTNGTNGYAKTAGPVLDTRNGFAVSAWARLPATKPTHAGIIATQIGSLRSGFELYYSSGYDRWIFNRYNNDTTDGTITRAIGTASPQGSEWTHLVGVYDAVAKNIKLYVNGQLQATTAYTTPWNATGPVQIGAGWYGTLDAFFPGEIDDVRLFDRIVTPEEVGNLFTQHPVVAARWKLNDSASAVRAATSYWKLDEAAGAPRAEEAGGAYPAGPQGGVTFGSAGRFGKAVHLDGTTGYLKTGGPVLPDTTKSFSVSAWAKLPATKPTHAAIIATQAGARRSGFELYYSSSYDRWIFNRYNNDNDDDVITRAQSTAVPEGGVWTHLAGVYDAANKQIRLYVNGKLNSTTAFTTPWKATGPVQIGAGWYGTLKSFFPGEIDDVRLYDQIISDSEIATLASGASLTIAADDGPSGRHVTLNGNARIDQGAGWVGTPPGGLVLDGDGDYAATSVPVVRTDESFTIAGWVTTAGRPSRAAAVFSQEGSVNSAFTLRYRPDPADPANAGGYQIEMPDKDATGAARPTAEHSAFQSGFDWDHVAIVYDAFQDEMRLYVNGELEQVEDTVSWRHNVIGFNAGKGLQLGRTKADGAWSEYWPGVIDDVWAFQGIATEEQIQMLAGGAELPTDTGL
ncbi:LamG-like jellyroll fold domain-containing protein [Microbispora sp. KK1-11]|uniref:LamG-like jellyroll fold domain-containing protein n=1 Tax=Microbispora sp. KK1-11 TaxID=2053005 RepID=UPI0011597680|nr:LamG-like jellyroll fold domain-containing protein [Microbispora sp. KK1-11]TQS26075.1 LamG domain-containing protein [Microbispora sp. KK1-11]